MPEESRTRVTRGPLLAVCGLCGGAGASTLAYLVALAEARRHSDSVLVADTGGPNGGVARYAGVEAPRSLTEVATQVVAGLPAGQLVATTRSGVRVLATGPRFTPECAREGIELLLDHARERYALTVIDCGTLAREPDQVALANASHVAWVLPASATGVRRARPVLDAINPYLLGRELIVARHDDGEPKAPLRELTRLAEHRKAPLVLLASVPDLDTSDPGEAHRDRAGVAGGDPWGARPMISSSLAAPAAPTARTAEIATERRHTAATCGTFRLAVRIAVLAFAAVLAVAGAVRIILAGHARGCLGYSFPGVPARAHVAIGIFAHNARAILSVFGLLLIAQLASRHPDGPGRVQQLILVAGDAILAGVIVANALVVGTGLGAYGARIVRAELPHGPVELAAYALALGLYVQGRRRALPAAHLAAVAATSVALLALAAALETFVSV